MYKVNGQILSRSEPLTITCVKCLAAPGDPCTGVVSRGAQVRKSNHVERWDEFIELERKRGSRVEFAKIRRVTPEPSPERVKPSKPSKSPKPVEPVKVPREPLPRGFDRFMASERWQLTREAAFLKNGRACRACKSVDGVEVYHRTFERFMREYAQDLVPFCPDCWSRVDALADDGLSVAAAMTQVCKTTRKAA